MSLEKHIKGNINNEDRFYDESFCNLIIDYISSYEVTEEDQEFLNENGYDLEDFEDLED